MTADDWGRRRAQLLEATALLERRRRLVGHRRYPAAAPGVDHPGDAMAEIDDELHEIQDELLALERETR